MIQSLKVKVILNSYLITQGGDYWADIEIGDNPSHFQDTIPILEPRPDWTNMGSAVMATSYAMMMYIANDQINDTIPLMKWIQTQRSSLFGWSSTQVSLASVLDNVQQTIEQTVLRKKIIVVCWRDEIGLRRDCHYVRKYVSIKLCKIFPFFFYLNLLINIVCYVYIDLYMYI